MSSKPPSNLLQVAQAQLTATQLLASGISAVRPQAQPVMGWPIYVDSATLNVVIYSRIAGLTQFVTARYIDLSGFIQTLIINAPVGVLTVTPIPSESFLLGVEFGGNTPATSIKRGQLYIQCYVAFQGASEVNPTNGLIQQPVTVLIQDYVENGYNPSWPNGRIVASTEGPGYIYDVAPANPSPGADYSITVPTGVRWRVRGFRSLLAADANVANRIVSIYFEDPAFVLFEGIPGPTQTAGQTKVYSFLPQYPITETAFDSRNSWRSYFPDIILPAGWTVNTITSGIDPGDQWEDGSLVVEEWLEP